MDIKNASKNNNWTLAYNQDFLEKIAFEMLRVDLFCQLFSVPDVSL